METDMIDCNCLDIKPDLNSEIKEGIVNTVFNFLSTENGFKLGVGTICTVGVLGIGTIGLAGYAIGKKYSVKISKKGVKLSPNDSNN